MFATQRSDDLVFLGARFGKNRLFRGGKAILSERNFFFFERRVDLCSDIRLG